MPVIAPEPARSRGQGLTSWLVLLAALLAVPMANAQVGIRPADERPGAPSPDPPSRPAPEVELQAVPAQPAPEGAPPLTFTPRGFDVVGVSAFEDAVIEAILKPHVGRPLAAPQLEDLVGEIRRRYREAGFSTTEVLLPDQDLADGIVRIRVIEGRVEGIEISGAQRYREGFYRARLERAASAPLHVPELIRRLERLQEEPAVERISAVLEEQAPGVHRLRVRVQERTPLAFGARASNHRSPSIGSGGAIVDVGHASLFGLSDRWALAGQFSPGLRDVTLDFSAPITAFDLRLGAAYRYTSTEIVDGAFAQLDIAGRYQSALVALRQPIALGGPWRLSVEAAAEWREAETSIVGRVDCFEPLAEDCIRSAAILRLRQEVAWRGRASALAARSTISIGLDTAGIDGIEGSATRGEHFVVWLAQLQWARRLPEIPALPMLDGMQLLFRGDLQLASAPLPTFEQVAVGGARTVRGYRQNQVVRDSAGIAAVELRVPLWRSGFDRPLVELAPFVDYGGAWDDAARERSSESLTSMGLSLRITPTENLRFELSWAHRFRDDLPEGDALQREGIYMELAYRVP